MAPILPPSAALLPQTSSIADPLQLNSSGLPQSHKRHLLLILLSGDRGTDEEIGGYQLIPLIQGRQRDSSVKRWEIH